MQADENVYNDVENVDKWSELLEIKEELRGIKCL